MQVSLSQDYSYSLRRYYENKAHINKASELLEADLADSAWMEIQQAEDSNSFYVCYIKAKCKQRMGLDYKRYVIKAYETGRQAYVIDSSDAVYLENVNLHDSLAHTEFRRPEETAVANRIAELLVLDQMYAESEDGSEGHHENRAVLDSIINASGWPSRYHNSKLTSGCQIILHHQGDLSKQEYEWYYKLITNECLAMKEDWLTALQILESRYQWYGTNLRRENMTPDTITVTLDQRGQVSDSSFAAVASLRRYIQANPHYNLQLTYGDERTAQALRKGFEELREHQQLPQAYLDFLKSIGAKMPDPDLTKRLDFVKDERMTPHSIAYFYK